MAAAAFWRDAVAMARRWSRRAWLRQPDRNNTNDGVIGGAANFGAYVLDTARMSDGAMLASKLIAIRAAGQPSCTA